MGIIPGANTDWYPSLMDSGIANHSTRVSRTHVSMGILHSEIGFNIDWYSSLVDSSTTHTILEPMKLEYQVEFLNTQMSCQMCHGGIENRELEFSELEY